MEDIQQTKGKRGGLAVIIAPGVEYTELYRTAIGVDFEKLKGPTLPPELVEVVNLFNTEDTLPDGVHDVSQRLEVEAADPNSTTGAETPQTQQTESACTTTQRKRVKRSPTPRIDNTPGGGPRNSQNCPKKPKRRKKTEEDTGRG